MSKIISYDFGHGVGEDRGASGIVNEEVEIRKYAQVTVDALTDAGYTLVNCTPTDMNMTLQESLSFRTNHANQTGSELHICFHVNAFNGQAFGSEIEVSSDTGERIAEPILAKIVALGFTKRGINKPSLWVTGHTTMPCVLIEPFFCDSASDCGIYNYETLGNAIAQGVIEALSGEVIVAPTVASQATTTVSTATVSVTDVKSLQHDLNRFGMIGADGKALTEDGVSGANTTYALKEFQYITGLTSDGVLGTITQGVINSITLKPLSSISSQPTKSVVRYIQWRIFGKNMTNVDGVWGVSTNNYVKLFQSNNKLTPDGIIGSASWLVLIGN